MLHDGSALVADFGIALAVSSAGGGSRMTETGMSLGTPHYMSPEQAMGEREITARSDVYALGAITYEMLVGDPPFTASTAQAIVAKVMTEKPASLIARRDRVPPGVEDAVLTALEKLPADRFASAAEFAEALTAPTTGTRRATAFGAHRSGNRRLGWLPMAAVVAAAVGIGVLGARLLGRPAPAQVLPVLRYAMVLSDSAALVDNYGSAIAYAPDGSVFAYSSRLGLMLRFADRLDAVPVPGGRRGTSPFFSPDSRWLGFQDGGRVVKVPLAGGTPWAICDPCTGYSFSWDDDDTVRYHMAPSTNPNSRLLMAVSGQGGTPYEIAKPDNSMTESFRAPMLVPGTRTVLFSDYMGTSSRLAALDLETHAITRFDQSGFSPQWVAAGFVTLGNSDGSLIALPFDVERGRPSGPPVTIARDVSQPDGIVSRAAVSASGAIVYPQVRRQIPAPPHAGDPLGIGHPHSGRGAGVRQPSLFPGWTPSGAGDLRS